jgi:hypothetical protein
MKLEDLIKDPCRSMNYLERYVNNGSPSGFSAKYRSKGKTDPLSDYSWYSPYQYLTEAENFIDFGCIPNLGGFDNDNNWIILHPDTVNNIGIFDTDALAICQSIKAVPTASSRTVSIEDSEFYLKLHYEGILGRVERALPYEKAVAGPEISQILRNDFAKHPNKLSFLDELGCRVLRLDGGKEVGMIVRSKNPVGANSKDIEYLIPYFSIFSRDIRSNNDEILLSQILKYRGIDFYGFAIDEVILPILEAYFYLVINYGFIPEWNAQNLLIGLDRNLKIVSVVFRDLQRVEKDLTIRESLNLANDFRSGKYKSISDNDELYQIRHSFSFDFKLCGYVINPIIRLLESTDFNAAKKARDIVKVYTESYLSRLPPNYLPKGRWYKHDDILLTETRPYIECTSPDYRD